MEEEIARKPRTTKNNSISAIQLLIEANERREEQKVAQAIKHKEELTAVLKEQEEYTNLIKKQKEGQNNNSTYDLLIEFYQQQLGEESRIVEQLKREALLSMKPISTTPNYQNWQPVQPQQIFPAQTEPLSLVDTPRQQSKNKILYYSIAGGLFGICITMFFTSILSKNNAVPQNQKPSYPAKVIFER